MAVGCVNSVNQTADVMRTCVLEYMPESVVINVRAERLGTDRSDVTVVIIHQQLLVQYVTLTELDVTSKPAEPEGSREVTVENIGCVS